MGPNPLNSFETVCGPQDVCVTSSKELFFFGEEKKAFYCDGSVRRRQQRWVIIRCFSTLIEEAGGVVAVQRKAGEG